jgi:hypothetical protein
VVLRLSSREFLRGSDLQAALPSLWLGFLCRLQLWSIKDKKAYGSMVRTSRRNREVRSENPLNSAWQAATGRAGPWFAFDLLPFRRLLTFFSRSIVNDALVVVVVVIIIVVLGGGGGAGGYL